MKKLLHHISIIVLLVSNTYCVQPLQAKDDSNNLDGSQQSDRRRHEKLADASSMQSLRNAVKDPLNESVEQSPDQARGQSNLAPREPIAKTAGAKNYTNKSDKGSNLVERKHQELFSILTVTKLSTSTRELAEQLEILPLLDELYEKKGEITSQRKAVLREKILETILESYFDAASVQAEAEREQGKLDALRQTLVAKRDKQVEINNATNFIASGSLNTLGSVLGFSDKLPSFPGNFQQMLSGVLSATMSTYALKQQAGGRIRGEGSSTVLAELFGRPSNDHTSYPESVWRFFHGRTLDDPSLSRIEAMEKAWIERNELEPHGSKRESLKLDLVCGLEQQKRVMTIDDLTDQINMISDVSALASLMTHHLRDLLRMIDSDVLE